MYAVSSWPQPIHSGANTWQCPGRLTWTVSPGASPHPHLPFQSQCCGWTGPCGCKANLGNSHQGTPKNQGSSLSGLEGTWQA